MCMLEIFIEIVFTTFDVLFLLFWRGLIQYRSSLIYELDVKDAKEILMKITKRVTVG